MEENNLLPELGNLNEPVVQKEEPAVSTESLLRIAPTELTSPFASETERITYQKASREYLQGVESAPDFLDSDGVVRNVREKRDTGLINPYIDEMVKLRSSDDMDDDTVNTIVSEGGLEAEERAYIAEKNAPVIAREKRIMENYSAYQAGRLTYEEFLLKTYGNDVLKAQGYHTDSIVWWKSQFREGNYQHPLDNEYLKAGVVQQAESLFALESFYEKMLQPSKNLDALVGKTLEGDDYRRVFGENWEKAVELLGSYERAITYFKGGYLGDTLTQLIYRDYDNNGNPVGDPAYYMSTDGKLYELVDRATTDKIDKSRQMFLYKNADGSVDRVSTARNEFQELGGSFVNGMAGAFFGIVDLVSMVGMDIATAFQEDNFWDGASKLFLPLINKLWNKDDKAFTDAYASYTATTNEWKTPSLKVQSFDTNKWDADNVIRAVGSGLGFIVETGIEIAVGVATAGAGSAALASAKAAKAAGGSAIRGALGGLKTTVTNNLARIVAGKTLKEGGEVLVKELSEEVAEKGINETVEKAMSELTTAGVKEILEASGVKTAGLTEEVITEQGKSLVKDLVTKTIREFDTDGMVVNIAAKEVQDGIVAGIARKSAEVKTTNGVVRSFGRFVKEGTKWTLNKGVRLSNTLRSLNSGSTPLFSRAATKRISKMFGNELIGRKWGTTVARATLGSIITIGETAANQRTLQQVRPEIEDKKIIENSLVAGLITFGSTMLLASSTDDRDNVARLSKELSEEKTELLRIRNKLGSEAYGVKSKVEEELAKNLRFQQAEAAKKVLDAFDKFDVGKYLRKQSSLRIVGGVSELLDNVLTGAVRNAANMGVDNIWGTVFSMEGVLNPEIVVPSLFSTGVSVIGRRGIFGIGDNEGSMMKGAAASKATVQKMYTDLLDIVTTLQKNAAGTADEMAIITLKTQLEADFAQAWKDNNGDKALASIQVLENLSKGLGADPNNPLKVIDGLVNNLKETEAFKTSLKNGEFAHIEGFTNKKGTKLNSDFSFTKYITKWYDKDTAKNVYAYERAIIAEYELRRKIRNEAFALAGSDSTNKIAAHLKQIGTNFLHPIRAIENAALKMTERIDLRNQGGAITKLFANIAGEYAQQAMSIDSSLVGVDQRTTAVFNLLREVMGDIVSENEIKLSTNAIYNRFEKRFGERTVITGIDEYLISEKKFVVEITQALKDNNFAKDDLEAAKLLALTYNNSKVKYEELDDDQKKAYDFIKDRVKEQNKINKQFALDYGLTEEQLNKILANSKGDVETAKQHLQNGAIVTFATRKDLDLANASPLGSEEREYIDAVRRGIKLLNVMNEMDGDGQPLDFVILSDGDDNEGGIKVFIASPKPITDVTTVLYGPEKLKKIILLGGLIGNPKANPKDVMEHVEALFAITKYSDRVYYSIKQIVDKGLGSPDPSDYIHFLNELALYDLVDKKVLAKVVLEMTKSDEDFHVKTIKEIKNRGSGTGGETEKILKVLTALKTINDITKTIKADTILPADTASKLADAASVLKDIVGTNEDNKYILEEFGLKDIKDLNKTLETLSEAKRKNFKLTQSELEQAQVAFSIQSKIYLDGEADQKKALIKKIRTLKSLGLSDKFNEAIKRIEEDFNKNVSRIDAIEKLLSDLVEFKKIIDPKTASEKYEEINKIIASVFVGRKMDYDLGDGKGFKDIPFINEAFVKKLASEEMKRLNKQAKTQALTQEEQDLLGLYIQTYEIADGKNKTRLSINEMLAKHPGIEDLLYSEKALAELKKSILGSDLLKAHSSFKAYKKYYIEELLGPYLKSIEANKELTDAINNIEADKDLTFAEKVSRFNEVIMLGYEEAKIYDNLEEAIFNAVEARNELYNAKGVIPFSAKVNKVTVNIGEVVAKPYLGFEKEINSRGINSDNEIKLDDIVDAARSQGDIIGSVTTMNRLYHRYGKDPILKFDLSIESERRDFETLLRTLGYSVEDFNEASEGKTLKIQGMYFNNDNAAIEMKKGEFRNLQDLVRKEMNALILKEVNSLQSQAVYDRAMIRSMFPQGIIGLSEDSPIRIGKNKIPFNMNVDDLFDLVAGYNALSFGNEAKSGKLARGSAAYYTELIGTITAQGKEPVEFQNLMLLRSIADGMATVNMKDTKGKTAKIFRIPDGADLEALRSFGWEISEDNTFITGFNKDTNIRFFKESDGNVDLFEILPITKADDNDFVRFNPKAGGGTADTFETLFYSQLNAIFGGDGYEPRTTNGTFKILPNSTEGELVIPDDVKTYGEAIEYFSQPQFKNNITAISFVFALKSAIKASEQFDKFLSARFSKEEVQKLKTIGILIESPDVLKALVGNEGLSDEEILTKVRETIDVVRQKAKRSAEVIAAQSNNQATIESTTEKIYIGESFTYAINNNLPDSNLIELDDINLLRRYATQRFTTEAEELILSSELDLKNRFLSLLSEDDEGNIALPIANISKITIADLETEIIHNNKKLKLGSYIKDTFGDEFYNNLYNGIELYDKTFLINRSLKLKTNEYVLPRFLPHQAGVRENYYHGSLNPENQKTIGKNAFTNKGELARRRMADQELENLSTVENKDFAGLGGLVDYAIENIDNETIHPFRSLASTRVANVNNRIVAANLIDNTIAIKDMLLNDKIKVGENDIPVKFTEEKAEELARQIVTLSTTSLNKAKTSFIILEVDENGDPKTRLVMSRDEDPYSGLLSEMSRIERNNSKFYLLSVESGFSLKTTDKDSVAFKMVDITGFNESADPNNLPFGRKLFVNMLVESLSTNKDLSNAKTVDEFNKAVALQLMNYRVDDEVAFMKERLSERFKENSEALKPLLALFKNTASEISASSPRRGYKDQIFYNTVYSNDSIIRQKETNASVLRRQGVIFDNLDREKKDVLLESIIRTAGEEYEKEFLTKPKKHRDRVMMIVNDLIEGKNPGVSNLQFNTQENQDLFFDVLKVFATKTDNTAFKKFVLENIASDGKVDFKEVMKRRKDGSLASKNVVLQVESGGSHKSFELSRVQDPTTSRFSFDGEWVFEDKDGKKYHWQLGYSFINEYNEIDERLINIKIPDDVLKEIKRAKENPSAQSDYREFVKFLDKDNNYDKFIKSQENAVSPKEAMAQMKEDILSALSNEKIEALVFMSHNGKGKGSDIETMRSSFGDDFKEIDLLINGEVSPEFDLGKVVLGHVDLYLDVITKTFLDTNDKTSSEENKSSLQSLGRKYLRQDYQEKHTASDDARDLLEIFDAIYKTDNVKTIAETKIYDYVEEIYHLLGGKGKLDETLINQINQSLKFTAELDEDQKNRLTKWNQDLNDVTEEMKKAVFDGLNEVQRKIEYVSSRLELEAAVRKLVPYDYEKLKEFFDTMPVGSGNKVRAAIDKVYTITSDLNLYQDSFNKVFINKFINALVKIHPSYNDFENSNNKMVTDYYSDDTFMTFAKSVVERGDEYIDTIVKKMIEESGMDIDPSVVTKSADLSGSIKDGFSIASGEVDMTDFAANSVISRMQKKIVPLINELILDSVKDGLDGDPDLVTALGEQLFTIFGSEQRHDIDAVKAFDNATKTLYINDGSLASHLRAVLDQGFKGLSIDGLYRTAVAITPGMKERLGLENTTGKIVTNDKGVEQLLGMSLDEYKELNNLQGKRVFISIFRQPGDRMNPIHAYELLVDNSPENGSNSFFAISAHEIVSKHGGDFDGDKLNIIVPDIAMQEAYNDSGYLDEINKPYIAMEKFINELHDIVGLDYVYKDTMKFLKTQKIVAGILKSNLKYYATPILEGIINSDFNEELTIKKLLGNDVTYKNFLDTTRKSAKRYKLDFDALTDEQLDKEILDSIVVKESRGYLLHNRNMVSADGEIYKDFLKFLNKTAIKEFTTKVMFSSELRYRDSVTGEAQKALLKEVGILDKDAYVTLKFDGDIYTMLNEANKNRATANKVIDALYKTGIDKKIIDAFVKKDEELIGQNIYNIFAIYEESIRNSEQVADKSKVFKKELFRKTFKGKDGNTEIDYKDAMGQEALDEQIARVTKSLELYNSLMPEDFFASSFSSGKRLSVKEAVLLLDMVRNSERYSRARDTKRIVTLDEAIDLGIAKDVKVLVDLDPKGDIAESTAKLTTKKNYIYVSEGRPIGDKNFKSEYEGTYQKMTKKPIIVDMFEVDVYRLPFDKSTKLTTLNAGSFGKVELTGGIEEDPQFKKYDYIIGLSTFKKANESFDPETFEVEYNKSKKNKSEKIVEINGKKYLEIKMKVGINENVAAWPQEIKDISVDPITMVHSFGTVESLPIFGGAFVTINEEGDVIWDATSIANVAIDKEKRRKSTFRPNNFLSTYNQLRAIKVLKFGLENIKASPENEDFIQEMKEALLLFKTPNKNFGSERAFAYVTDMIKYVNDKTENGFLNYLNEKASEINKRLFSKKLWDMAFINTTTAYNFDSVKEKYRKMHEAFNGHVFYSKGGAEGIAQRFFDNAEVPTHLSGKTVDTFSGDTEYSSLYMNQLDALNYLISNAKPGEKSSEFISKSDAIALAKNGLSSLAMFDESSMAIGYRPATYVSGIKARDSQTEIKAKDRGVKSGIEGESAEKRNVLTTTWGILPDADKDYNYFPGSIRTDEKGRAISNFRKIMNKLKIDKDGKILVSDNSSSVNANIRSPRFIKQMLTFMDDKLGTNDKILRFKSMEPESVVAHINPTYGEVEKGLITTKYSTDQAVKANTFAEVEEAMKNKFTTPTSGQMFSEKVEIAEASNLFSGDEIGFIQKARNQKVELNTQELIELNAKLTKSKIELDTADATLASMNGDTDRLLSMARERRNYFKGVTEGNIEEIRFERDFLDTEGMNPKGIAGIQIKQGIQNFAINAKRYQMELTDGLEMIKRMIGNDSYQLEEFNRFSQARLIQLAHQEAKLKSNEYSMNLAKSKMIEMGFRNVDEVENFISNYNKANPGLTNIYLKIINDLKVAATEAAMIIGAKDTPDELFLLSPLKKKVDINDTNKSKYYSTLDTLFLDKRSNLESIIERATDLNFGLSVWSLAGNIAKIKALNDAQKMFVKSGAIENKTIYDIVNKDFRSRLRDVGESENKMTYLEKEELLRVLKSKHPDLFLSKELIESKTFLADVYDEIESYISHHNGDASLKNMTLYELDERLKVSRDQVEIDNINALIEAKKTQRDFMSDVITLVPSMAKNIYEEIQAVANTKGAVLTNEFMQILPEDGKSTFSFLAGYDLKTIKRNVEYQFSGDTKEQRIAYMALTGNLFLTEAKLAKHLDKYYFTNKVPTKVENILSQAKGTFTNFVMSVPHKLINRMTQYSIGDLALISVVDPTVVTKLPTVMNELTAFYSSKGASLERSPKLKLFLETIGFNPMSYQHGSLNFETMDYDSPAKLGQVYFDAVEKVFTAQTLTFRYALWLSLYDRFEAYEADPSKDKRLYGSLNYMKDQIDAMESSEVKAREIVNAAIGGPNGFALIARKELKNWGMFLTYPLALMRAGVGHLKSMAGAFNEIIQGTANNATKRYVVNTGLGIAATQVMISAFAALIASIYGVDEETEEEWKKRGTYIDPFLTLINDRPIPISMGTTGLTKQLREMFYEPFEEAEGNFINGGWNWLTANVLSKINPLIKTPVELITGKEFYGNAGPQDTTARDFQENFARKVLSMFIGQSGAIAMTDQWYYTRVGKEDKHFVSKLAESVKEAIKGEMGNYRGYKQESKNYFKALSLLRGFKAIENPSDGYTIYDNNNGFDLEEMSALSKEIKTAMDKGQPPSVIYGIIDEYIKDGVSSSTIKAALFNNSISGKISQIKNFDRYYQALSAKEKVILDDAIKFESTNYSIVKSMIDDYIAGSNKKYKKSIYIPHNYYTYPSSNKYNDYRSYQRSWFDDDKWKKYAKDYMEYRARENFVPSLTTTTGKYAKDFYDYSIPRIKRVNGKIRSARYQEEGYNRDNHKVNKKGR